MNIKAIRGFKDILPQETSWWRKVEETAAGVLESFGYKEIRIPLVERTSLFARSIGADTDIVEKEMYTFPDRRDELMTLRPEATAGIVRAVIEHNLAADGRPQKMYFIGPMFRYERPQKGRQRQFHQLDVEAFNDPSARMDAELIVLLDHFLKELGLKGVTVNVNSLGCPDCRPAYKEKLQGFLRPLSPELCPDCRRRLETSPLRVLDCKVERCGELTAEAPLIIDSLGPECLEHFDIMRNCLERAGVSHEVNPKLVRGLDYYSRTTFEALTGDLGAQNAVAGGGRYDGLAEAVGGPHIPASGWAAGLERLILLLSERDEAAESRPELFVAALNEEAQDAVFPLVQTWRRQGLRVEIDYAPSSLKSKMKRADKIGAEKVLILGPDEMARKAGIIRDMTTKEQRDFPLDQADNVSADIFGKGESS